MASLRVIARLFHSSGSSSSELFERNPTLIEQNTSKHKSKKVQKKSRDKPSEKPKPTKKQKQKIKEAKNRKKTSSHTTPELGDDADVCFDVSSEDSQYDITEAPVTSRDGVQSPKPFKQKDEILWQMGGLIGNGSFGTVRMGMNIKTGELMAVKQVPLIEEVEGSCSTQVESLQREIEILSSLRHHNIVRYIGTGREENTLNIFLEYVTGGSIQSLLAKMGPFPEEVIAVYTKQILYGLEYLHSNNIVHRDIKGGNILVSNDGVIKLADFGASKKLEGVANHTGKGSLKGTVYWMAPEVARQETSCGKEADIWSLGCTVYEMAVGCPPWSEYPDQVSALFHIASVRSPPCLKNLNISSIALSFLKQCFKLSPSKRPTARELLYHPFVNHTPTTALKRDSSKNSYSSPDYNQSSNTDTVMRQASSIRKHKRNQLSYDFESLENQRPSGVSKPVASPFVFLNRSGDSSKKHMK